MQRGSIKWYCPVKGFGFIKHHGKDIFFPSESLPEEIDRNKDVVHNQRVSFFLAHDQRNRIMAVKLNFTNKLQHTPISISVKSPVPVKSHTPSNSTPKSQTPNSFEHECARLSNIDVIQKSKGTFFIFDKMHNFSFLLDTGATKSLLPKTRFAPTKKCNDKIVGVTGNSMQCYGTVELELDLQLATSFKHNFLVVDLPFSYGILGNDFFSLYAFKLCFESSSITHTPTNSFVELLSSPCRRHIVKMASLEEINKVIKTDHIEAKHKKSEEESQCLNILKEFPTLLQEPSYFEAPKHKFCLDIELTDDRAIYQKPRPVPAREFQAINENFEKLLKCGAVIKKASKFASPVTVVKKKSGDFRICADYRKLNDKTVDLNFPIPSISNLQFLLTEKHKWFSVIDLRSAYYSLPLTERASERAAIITQRGTYQPLRSPFGLKNSPAAFCELISAVISGLESFTYSYLDDFLIYSKTFKDHKIHLRSLLERLRDYGLYLSEEKCVLAQKEVVFLGHIFSSEGIRPLEEKTDLIATLRKPKTLRELRSFLGVANYYRDHCRNFSKIVAPLNDLLKGPKRSKNQPYPGMKNTKQHSIKPFTH